ncbi:MAG TPA: hypothetical protein PKW33_17080 [Anaerolineaceae bacterium]|nr:hypothetical protein [Anaerolineaceae bacterium]HPN53313.1 hypothetical protein [Anaerolineaceae bacterium]
MISTQVEFAWIAGLAASQRQKCVQSLHQAAASRGLTPLLEISSFSMDPLGVALSAFNLRLQVGGKTMPVECAFQGSKVFSQGGPFVDLYEGSSPAARSDPRLRASGPLTGFQWQGQVFPLNPPTAFYDWLYLTALQQNPELATALSGFNAFTDIVFNPQKSLNCQARSAALFSALRRAGLKPALSFAGLVEMESTSFEGG